MESIPVIKKSRKRRKSNRKLIFLLLLFFISILVLLFFHSSLSKIQSIEIYGATMTEHADIVQASGIQLNDSFFSFKKSEAITNITKLPWVDSATISKHFPGKVEIEVREHRVVAYELREQDERFALLSDGSTLPLNNHLPVLDIPVITGWEYEEANKKKLASTIAEIPASLLQFISEITPIPTDAYPDKIRIYTRSSFEIVTTIEYLPDKLIYLPSMISDLMKRNITEGVLTLLEADTYAPYQNPTSKLEE